MVKLSRLIIDRRKFCTAGDRGAKEEKQAGKPGRRW